MNEQVHQTRRAGKAMSKVRRHWLTLSFVFGFILDNITLNRVDQVFDNLVLFFYVNVAMISMLLLYASAADKLGEKWGSKIRFYAPMLVQFSFGGLLSGMLIFYGRSGAWAESWPFMLIILVAIYGNETISDRAARLLYNISILYIALFSYVVLVIPVLTGQMGAWVFVGSGVLATMIIYGFIQLLTKIIPRYMALQMKAIVFTVGLIFVGFNTLYFTNVIPPIPLSLKEVGIYHSVVRFEDGTYQLKYEDGKWYQPFKKSDRVFHPTAGGNVFCFAKVFAPTKIQTEIYHSWEYLDEDGKWVKKISLPYSIAGGRGDGFRGYTLMQSFFDGDWRCSVETERGQVLGRENFVIDSSAGPEEFVTRMD